MPSWFFISRLIVAVTGLGDVIYFAWRCDFRYLPGPLLVLALSLMVHADTEIASALLRWGGWGGAALTIMPWSSSSAS